MVDNESTDSSMDVVEKFRKENRECVGKIINVLSIKTEGYEWQKILRFACDYMHKNLSHYEWILLIDADSFYYSPVKGMSLIEFLNYVKRYGYNIIDGKLYEFFPTEKDDSAIDSPIRRPRYAKLYAYKCPQEKIFLYNPGIDFYTRAGHVCLRKHRRVFITPFIYEHYKWVSRDHGLKKIFQERIPRFIERKKGAMEHPQYLGMLPLEKDLVKNSRELQYYNRQELLLSPLKLFFAMKLRKFIEIFVMAKGWDRRSFVQKCFAEIKRHSSAIFYILSYDKNFASRYLSYYIWEIILDIKRAVRLKMFGVKPSDRYWGISVVELVRQKSYAFGLPRAYHFLMTNFCNARCLFCNQGQVHYHRKEITLEKFKGMVSNIPNTTNRSFSFSGGRRTPALQRYFPIIKHVNTSFPETRVSLVTNGLLIGDYSEKLAQHNIHHLEISVHAASARENNAILQVEDKYDVFQNISVLNDRLSFYGKKMRKLLHPVVSQRNIDEIPGIIENAACLKIDEVKVSFCRYYPEVNGEKRRVNPEESLFFNKKKYNDTILKSRKIAKKLKISFNYEPLFFHNFKQRPCFQPWNTILIDWDGDVYPCCGGEVWFRKKVKSGDYHFGNLLSEHLSQCWNNETYTMIRRTCSHYYKENFIPECESCPNTICLKGSDIRYGYILKNYD